MLLLPSRNLIGAGGGNDYPQVGMAWPEQGGFMLHPNYGNGLLTHLVVADRSQVLLNTMAPTQDGRGGALPTDYNAHSWADGISNTAVLKNAGPTRGFYQIDALVWEGQSDWYAPSPIEIAIFKNKLNGNVAPAGSPFVSGGSQALFSSDAYWSSAEYYGSNTSAFLLYMTQNNDLSLTVAPKSQFFRIHPFRRVLAEMPYAPGTYLPSEGGYVLGYHTVFNDVTGATRLFMIIISPKEFEYVSQWATFNQNIAPISNTDGLANTQAIVAALGSSAPAAYYCTNLIIMGKTGWYLPTYEELLMGNGLMSYLPAGQRYDMGTYTYHSSVQDPRNPAAQLLALYNNFVYYAGKTANGLTRPMRRVELFL